MEGYLLIITVLYGMTIGCQGQVDVNLGNDGQTNSEHLMKPELLVSSQADTLEPLRDQNGASAFYVALSRAASIGASETLKFDKVITNNGNVYDVTNGQFTAPASGTYIFHLSLACEEGSYIEVSIVEIDIGDDFVKPMFNTICDRRQNSGFHQNGGSAILRLVQGDSVMVKMLWPNYEKQKVAGNGFTTFSGYMLSSW